jgi:C1A family cysteine protease
MRHIFNLVPDRSDPRDVCFLAPPFRGLLPDKFDVREKMGAAYPASYNQGELGSCTGNGLAFVLAFAHWLASGKTLSFSRLFIYFCERLAEGTVDQDAGAQIRDGIKTIARQGACLESTWPYDITQFAVRPPAAAFAEALGYQAISYTRVPAISAFLKGVLASGFPIVCGIAVYESFETEAVARTGVVPMPDTSAEQCLGGHCIVIIGYDAGGLIFRNSWDVTWGNQGHGHLPWAYLPLISDAWVVRKAE